MIATKLRRHLISLGALPIRSKPKVSICLLYLTGLVFWYALPRIDESMRVLNVDSLLQLPTENKTYTSCAPDGKNWAVFHAAKVEQIRTRWMSFVSQLEDYPRKKFAGRGIVTSTRKTVYPYFLASLHLLRWHGSKLPIEVFMFTGELDDDQLTELHKIEGVSVRIVNTQQTRDDRSNSRYAIKLHAILESRFEEILWLDADNIVVRDPEYLFDLPHYTRSTAMFWPDFWTTSGNNPIWRILNLTCRAEDYEQEAGQLLINKKRAWKALNLAAHFNRDSHVMKLLLGDKDTFRLSWRALNTSFYFIRKYLAIAGFYHTDINGTKQPEFCGHTMVQHDPFGEILFLHANMVKYHPKIKYAPETNYPEVAHLPNPWRVLRRYANSASYFKASIFHRYGYSCTTFPSDGPALYENDFHQLIAPTITMTYLQLLGEKTNDKDTSAHASFVR